MLHNLFDIIKRLLGIRSKVYGWELIIDLSGCESNLFNRSYIEAYFIALCKRIGMTRCDLHWWDDTDVPEEEKYTEPHLKGTSAVQFIVTSDIVIHTLDLLDAAFINIFSCKPFSKKDAICFTKLWFGATKCRKTSIKRIYYQ